MITKWKLHNFKSVRAETQLPFALLTIFAGPNSSGKSSWIQSILMISQTLAHRIGSRSVVLNGALARLGQFDDLRSFDSPKKDIVIGWECQSASSVFEGLQAAPNKNPPMLLSRAPRRNYTGLYTDEIRSVYCEIAFDVDATAPRRRAEIPQLQPSLSYCKLSCSTLSDDEPETTSIAEITRTPNYRQREKEFLELIKSSDSEDEAIRQSLEFQVILDPKSLEEVRHPLTSTKVEGCIPHHFFPGRLCVSFDAIEERAQILASALTTGSQRPSRRARISEQEIIFPREIISLLKSSLGPLYPPSLKTETELFGYHDATLRDWQMAVSQLRVVERYRLQQAIQSIPSLLDTIQRSMSHGMNKDIAARFIPPPEGLSDAVSYLEFFFTNLISYLGPLRDEPKALYPLPTSPDLTYVGLRGEYTAAVLDLHKYRYVEYIPPTYFAEPPGSQGMTSTSLISAVSEWLQYLGVAESVSTRDQGKLGHELKVKTAGVPKTHDLTHAGVGLSQVLPILVNCLLSGPEATLLFEQPELHLHPGVQSRLGDFFLSMALLGKQCVIETHSEHLINRLRFRIASSEEESLSSLTKIYFVEKKTDASTFREVIVNDFGAIPDWPDGFFDQSQDEAEKILRAAAQKRRRLDKATDDAKRNN